MAKRTSKKGKTRSAGRVNRIKSNGALPESQAVAPTPEPERVPVGEAMRKAVEELGPMNVVSDLAAQQLEDIGTAVEELARRKAALAARLDEAKTAKKGVDAAQELLNEKCRLYTHPDPLPPLVDMMTREQDQDEMLDAIESGGDADLIAHEPPLDDELASADVDA